MIVWSDNQIPKFSEGYGYTPDCLYEFIGSSGLPISRSKPSVSDIGRMRMGFNFDYLHIDDNISANKIIINHSIAEAFIKSSTYSVGFTFWETNKLPQDWVDDCNQMDEVWTCSKAMQQVFIDSGITKPVYEFKLGVDPHLYFPAKRTPHSQFTFFSVGSPSTRKNSQLSVNAFLKVFGGNENYRMIYKSNGPPDARMFFGNEISALRHPQIEVIDDEYSHADFAKLYDRVDCILYPTSGEGWGNLPFQGIAKGIPTICTNALACTEYAEMSVPLDFTWDSESLFGRFLGCGQWAKPNFDDLCDKMKYVTQNYEAVSEKTYHSALWINKNMTWEKVSQPYIERIWQILNKQSKQIGE